MGNTLSSGYKLFSSYWWKHWLSPGTYWYFVKYKIQRANRGWADCDVWGLDNYLSEWLPDALKRLKKTKHGTPIRMFPENPEYIKEDGNPTETAHDIAEKKWDETLDKMIAGFEAYNRMQGSPSSYEPELGEFPHLSWNFEPIGNGNSRLVRSEEENRQLDAWMAREKPLIERDDKIWEEGGKLFIENFGSLWD